MNGHLEKAATNAWLDRWESLSPETRRELWKRGLVTKRPTQIPTRELAGHYRRAMPIQDKNRIPDVVPFQSPGMSLQDRMAASAEAQQHLDAMHSALRKAPKVDEVLLAPRVTDSRYEGALGELHLPDRTQVLSIMPLDKVDAHETGHMMSMRSGSPSKGRYTLQDRLLAKQVEDLAPGTLMGKLPKWQRTRGYLMEEAAAEANAARSRGVSNTSQDVLKHLRNNYLAAGHGGVLPFKSQLGSLIPAAQQVLIDPINVRGGKKIPGQIASFLSKALLRK